MVHCPRCSSPIGTELPVCPICHQPFSDADREAMASEQAAEEKRIREGQAQALEAFRRKRDRFTLALIAVLVLYPLAVFAVSELTKSNAAVIIAAVIGMAVLLAVIISGFVSGAVRCPYCDALLYHQHGPHCQHCGGRLR